MCHNGKLHCVKSGDVQKHLNKGWNLGYCGATSVAIASNFVESNSQSGDQTHLQSITFQTIRILLADPL